MDKDLNIAEPMTDEMVVVEAFEGVEELENRYEYEDTVWLCKYTVHF